MRKFAALACAAGASMALVTGGVGIASAGGTPRVTVSPSLVTPTNQYYAKTHALEGTAAVVKVTVGPNKVLKPGWPVEVMECQPHPTSESNCDVITVLPFDQLTKKRVPAAKNGSVTTHFLLWSPLPNRWDYASVLKVGPGRQVALWVGDDPSNWATTGLVSAPLLISAAGAQRGTSLHRAKH